MWCRRVVGCDSGRGGVAPSGSLTALLVSPRPRRYLAHRLLDVLLLQRLLALTLLEVSLVRFPSATRGDSLRQPHLSPPCLWFMLAGKAPAGIRDGADFRRRKYGPCAISYANDASMFVKS
jgi:hypothetical protein